jgi:hypothetical protein
MVSVYPAQKGSLANRHLLILRCWVSVPLVTALLGMHGCGKAPDSVEDATWAPAPEVLKHLGKAVLIKSVSVQLPAGYVQTKHPTANVYEAAGIKVLLWQKGIADRVSSSLTIVLFPPTKETWDAEKFIRGFSASMIREWQNTSRSEVRKGRLGGAAAGQFDYSGTTMGGVHVTGFLLAFNDAQGTVMVNAMAFTDAMDADLRILRTSAMTCRRVETDR